MSGCSGVNVGGGGYLPVPSQCYFPGGAWREATLSHRQHSRGEQPKNLSLGVEAKAQRQQLHRAHPVHRRTPLFKLPGLLSSKRIARVG